MSTDPSALPAAEDLPALVDEDVVDEDLAPTLASARPVRRRGLGIRLTDLAAALDHEADRSETAGHGLAVLLRSSPARLSNHSTMPAPASADPRGDGRLLAEAQWLITPTAHVLHHYAPDRVGGAQLVADGWIEQDGQPSPIALSCGRSAWTVVTPNALERHSLPRCEDCCTALDMPAGLGSPVNDPSCERALTGRITAVAHPTTTTGGTP